MRIGHRLLRASVFGLLSAGCGGHALEVGSTASATDAEVMPDVDPFADADPAAPQVWAGRFVNHELSNGSDRLTLTVQFSQDGSVTGTLLLGDGAVLAPPTDPDVGYPPYAVFNSVRAIEGFRYTIRDGRKSGSAVTLRVVENEAWSQWCAIQTSYFVPPIDDAGLSGGYTCSPPLMSGAGFGPTGCTTFDAATKQTTPIDCAKIWICDSSVCLCTPTSCSLNTNDSGYLDLTLSLAGDVASGSTSDEFGSFAVTFKRTE